jgi:endonuclease-3
MSVDAGEARETMRRVVENLEGEYGARVNERDLDPLDTLVQIILSQQNSSVSTRKVFAELKRRFPTWERALAAPVARIEQAIRSGGLARQKAARIKALLASIEAERGLLDLGFLRGMAPEEALAYLLRFSGVGPKTARCTLLFACDADAFPMDVHIFRILARLGLLDARMGDERAHRSMEALIPPGKHYSAHVNLIAHGRAVCRPTAPRCDACCVIDYCPTGQERLLEADPDDPRMGRPRSATRTPGPRP